MYFLLQKTINKRHQKNKMMKYFELKIPPLLVFVIFAGLMWLTPLAFKLEKVHLEYNLIFLLSFLSVALFILLMSAYSFKKAKTTVNPIQPNSSSSLVTNGCYRFTRNPMYLSFTLLLISWGVFLTTIESLIFVPLFIAYINYFQIKPEEKALHSIFGQAYTDYKNNVRRWI